MTYIWEGYQTRNDVGGRVMAIVGKGPHGRSFKYGKGAPGSGYVNYGVM